MTKPKLSCALAPFFLVVLGCGQSGNDEITETSASSAVFEGAPDARFAGHWSASDDRLSYDLKPDGAYESDALFAIKGKGDAKTHSKGEWRVKGEQMLFKDGDGNVVPYHYELKGDSLTFTSTGTLKSKTVLKRKSSTP